MLSDMTMIFENANQSFLNQEVEEILRGVSERNLCGKLMGYLKETLDETDYKMYHVDIEYNRNGNKLKTILNGNITPINITCDLIVHSRGQIVEQDNLIALEMKRSTHPNTAKNDDKIRLKCLTKDSFDDVWSFDGKALPKHVCRYVLGVYYEFNIDKRQVDIMYFYKGKILSSYSLSF